MGRRCCKLLSAVSEMKPSCGYTGDESGGACGAWGWEKISARNKSAVTRRIFMKFDISGFF